MFDRSYRGSKVAGIVGTGTGLYLVKMIVDLHKGQIALENRVGEGAKFNIHLLMV